MSFAGVAEAALGPEIAVVKGYWTVIKWVLIALTYIFVGWTCWHWSAKLVHAEWDKEKLAQLTAAAEQYNLGVQAGYQAGSDYEKKRAVIQGKLTTPDRKLDDVLQTPAGDALIPGDLGMRLNALSGAEEASPPSSGPDGAVRSGVAVPHGERPGPDLAPAARDQHGQ